MAHVQSTSQNNRVVRIAVTLAALFAYRLGNFILLPGIDFAALTSSGASEATQSSLFSRLSILALGMLPWFSALTFLELLTLLLPKTWTQRFSADGHAQPFSPFVIGLALIISALQALGVAQAMVAMPNLVQTAEPGFVASATVTLLAGSAVLVALAVLIERHGIGLGFWILLAASILDQLPQHIGVIKLMLRQGMASPAVMVGSLLSTVAVAALVVALLRARQRAAHNDAGIFIWPLVLASLASGLIVAAAALFVADDAEHNIDAMAHMLTNEPVGFVIGGLIASLFAAKYASQETDWQFFLPAVGVIAAVQAHALIGQVFQVQPLLGGASLVIVTAVGYLVVTRGREAG